MVGWMDHGLRGQKGNIFIPFFLFMLPLLMGVIFLITNMVNKQIILQTKV